MSLFKLAEPACCLAFDVSYEVVSGQPEQQIQKKAGCGWEKREAGTLREIMNPWGQLLLFLTTAKGTEGWLSPSAIEVCLYVSGKSWWRGFVASQGTEDLELGRSVDQSKVERLPWWGVTTVKGPPRWWAKLWMGHHGGEPLQEGATMAMAPWLNCR